MAETGRALTDFVLTDDELCACSLEAGHPLPALLETVNVTDAGDLERAASRGLFLLGKRGVVGDDFPANRLAAVRDLLLGKPLVRISLTRRSEGSVKFGLRLNVVERLEGDQVIVWTSAPGGFHGIQIRDRGQVSEFVAELFAAPSAGLVDLTLWVDGRPSHYQLPLAGAQPPVTTTPETNASALDRQTVIERVREALALG